MSLETHNVQCPYCGETVELDIEVLEEAQSFVEDCSACGRPMQVEVAVHSDDEIEVIASRSE